MTKLIFLLVLIAAIAKGQQNIVQVEYWIDQDPGYGAAIQVTGFTAQPDVQSLMNSIAFNLPVGLHPVGYRSKDASNNMAKIIHLNCYGLVTEISRKKITTNVNGCR